MIGILLITHGTLGEALVQCACHVLNKRPAHLAQLGVAGQDDPLDLLPLARKLCEWVDDGSGVLVMTDLYGASPANLAAKLLDPGRVECVTGVNLPMLLRALNYRDKDLHTLMQRSITGACDGILQMK